MALMIRNRQKRNKLSEVSLMNDSFTPSDMNDQNDFGKIFVTKNLFVHYF